MAQNKVVKLNFKEYQDKVYACWIGKNIGGTMGTPYEGVREFLDIKGFSTEEGVVLPNDDLDLQLIWLAAAERFGMGELNAEKLGEMWLSFITPHWNEYGICKSNMRKGLIPSVSGDYNNDLWKTSNGAWIRTEIWACLQPGRPDIVASYAYEDACVDHGNSDGSYAAIFVAVLQSVAFVINNIHDCIDVALEYIPKDSRTYKTVECARECYRNKVDFKEARDKILNMNADIGSGWFQAPSNVGYAVLGLLYGEGDFKKSMILAIDCGDDTDCTGATVGATLGILYGMKGIPADWKKHIGDEIVTVSINKGEFPQVPKTCTELTERVVRLARGSITTDKYPTAYAHLAAVRQPIELVDGETEIPEGIKEYYQDTRYYFDRTDFMLPYAFKKDFIFGCAAAYFEDGIDIKPNEVKKFKIRYALNRDVVGTIPIGVKVRFWLPDGFRIEGKKTVDLPSLYWGNSDKHYEDVEYTLYCPEEISAENRVVVEITGYGRTSTGYIPIVLLG